MAHSHETVKTVRTAFINGHPLRSAAKLADVSYDTARNWKRDAKADGDDWDFERSAKAASTLSVDELMGRVLGNLLTLIEETMTDIQKGSYTALEKAETLSRMTDSYHKAVNAASKSAPALNKLSVAMDVIQFQAQYIKTNHPGLIAGFIEMIEPFGEEVAKRYGK